jgi:hypothetical protein
MPHPHFVNFLHDPAEYAAAERFWRDAFECAARDAGVEGDWATPWLNTRFADGTPFADGNPIFSAWSPGRRLGLRIIQHDPATTPGDRGFESWVDTFDKDGDGITELVISCVLSESTAGLAMRLIGQWITPRPNASYIPASA